MFDLKLTSYYDRKNLETLEKRLSQAQEDNNSLLKITEEMVLEMERKDEAIQEAVALICQLEDKIKSLESKRSSSVSANATKEHSSSPPFQSPNQDSSPQTNTDHLDVPGLRPASSLSQKSSFRSSNTLRDIYLERQKFNTSRMSTLSDGASVLDNDRVLNEKMSILSMGSFGGMYGPVKESMSALKETQQRMSSIMDDEESEPETPTPAHSIKGQSSIDGASSITSLVRKGGGKSTSNTSVPYKSRGSREALNKSTSIPHSSTNRIRYPVDRDIESPQPDVGPAKTRAHRVKEASESITALAPTETPPTQKRTFSERIQSQGLSDSQRIPPPTFTQSPSQHQTVIPQSSHSKAPTPASSSRSLTSSQAASRKATPPSITPDIPLTEASSPVPFYSTPTTPSSGPLTSHPFTPTQPSYQNSSTSSLNSRRGRPPSIKETNYRPQEIYPDSPLVSRGSASVSNRGS